MWRYGPRHGRIGSVSCNSPRIQRLGFTLHIRYSRQRTHTAKRCRKDAADKESNHERHPVGHVDLPRAMSSNSLQAAFTAARAMPRRTSANPSSALSQATSALALSSASIAARYLSPVIFSSTSAFMMSAPRRTRVTPSSVETSAPARPGTQPAAASPPTTRPAR